MSNTVGEDEPRVTPEDEEQTELAKLKGMYEILKTGGSSDPLFSYRIGGHGPELQFTLATIPEEHRRWLSEVVYELLYKAYLHGRAKRMRELHQAATALIADFGLWLPPVRE